MRVFRSLFLFILALSFNLPHAKATTLYMEGGTSVGTLKNGDNFFKTPGLGSTGLGFVGSLSAYLPITSQKRFAHFELGIQNRFSSMTSKTGQSLDTMDPHLALRLEFWRFYVGVGYAPLTYYSTNGIMALKANQNTTAYFGETGIIWRVIPEFQIAATVALEYGSPKGGGTSPSPISEYGLRFRFPINPKEYSGSHGAKLDGFRYPFGVMR